MRVRCLSALAAVVTTLALPAVVRAQAPDGAGVFRGNCATCHDGAATSRAPSPEQLRARSPESIIAALTGGAMRYQGLSLSGAERRAVAEYLTGKIVGAESRVDPAIGRCAAPSPLTHVATAPAWNGWSADTANTHAVSKKTAGLTAADLPKLTLKWALGLPEATAAWAQPTIVGGRLFVGSQNGTGLLARREERVRGVDLHRAGRRARLGQRRPAARNAGRLQRLLLRPEGLRLRRRCQ